MTLQPVLAAVLATLVALVAASAGVGWALYLTERRRHRTLAVLAAVPAEPDTAQPGAGIAQAVQVAVGAELDAGRTELAAAVAEQDKARAARAATRDEQAAARVDDERAQADAAPPEPPSPEPTPGGLENARLVIAGLLEMYDRVTVTQRRTGGKALAWASTSITDLLALCDVVPIPADGEINPLRHHVVAVVPAPEPELDEHVAEIVRAGFTRHDELIRPADITAYVHQS
jgi:hypothetical protein